MPLSGYSGVFCPADLDFVQRVFDRLCEERRLARKDREQREDLARIVICLYQRGLTDEDELWRALTKRSRIPEI